MKTSKIACLLFILILLLGFDRFYKPDSTGVSSTVEPSHTSNSTPANAITNINDDDDVLVRDEVYIDTFSENCDINIKYPYISIAGKDTSFINYIIHNFVFSIIQLSDDRTGVTLNIDYKITLKNNKMISILFNGLFIVQ